MSYGDLEFKNTERLLELHAQYDVPACFAVVGAAAQAGDSPYSYPDQIRRIHAQGHEVASHTMYHDWIPGLSKEELKRTLRESKEALEQCIGAPVISLVPPYNQPMDLPSRRAWSISERRQCGRNRLGIPELCECSAEVGYRTCRVMFSSISEKFSRVLRRPAQRVVETPFSFNGITCLRLNGPAGFDKPVLERLTSLYDYGSPLVVYGHPHSIYTDGPQNERRLIEFLEVVRGMVDSKQLALRLPRDYVLVGSAG